MCSRRSETHTWGGSPSCGCSAVHSSRTTPWSWRGGPAVRVSNLFFLQGRNPITTDRILCGDVAAVAKVDRATTGSTLRSPGSDTVILPAVYPKPVMELAVFPRSTQDEEKLSTALQRAVEEDPTLAVERRSETGQTILAGLGDVHLDVTLARISRKYGVEVDTALPKIPYRETITGRAEAEGKHKKQTGGRGQFGVAFVRFAPQAQGEGYEFIDSIKGGSIPRQYIPAVDKGIREAFARGVLAGFPVIDVSAEVFDGKYHSVDSDELSFRMAGIAAVRAATQELRPVLLEPITQLSVKVPEEYTGDVIGDINSKRGPRVRHGHGRIASNYLRRGSHGRDPAIRRRPPLHDQRAGDFRGGLRPLLRNPSPGSPEGDQRLPEGRELSAWVMVQGFCSGMASCSYP